MFTDNRMLVGALWLATMAALMLVGSLVAAPVGSRHAPRVFDTSLLVTSATR